MTYRDQIEAELERMLADAEADAARLRAELRHHRERRDAAFAALAGGDHDAGGGVSAEAPSETGGASTTAHHDGRASAGDETARQQDEIAHLAEHLNESRVRWNEVRAFVEAAIRELFDRGDDASDAGADAGTERDTERGDA